MAFINRKIEFNISEPEIFRIILRLIFITVRTLAGIETVLSRRRRLGNVDGEIVPLS